MDSTEFTQRLEHLSAEEISAVAAQLRAEHDTADGEVAWWRATIAVSGALRRHRRTRVASVAAHRAAAAVVGAASVAGRGDDRRNDVTAVARAAAEVARVLVVGDEDDVPAAVREPLLHAWHIVVDAPLVAA